MVGPLTSGGPSTCMSPDRHICHRERRGVTVTDLSLSPINKAAVKMSLCTMVNSLGRWPELPKGNYICMHVYIKKEEA